MEGAVPMVTSLQIPGVMCDRIIPVGKQEAERVRLLTERMVRGEEAAFSEFHGLYSDRLFRYLLVLTRGQEDFARELCQATMVKVVRAMREFADEEHLWNWMARVGRNCFIDALRKRKRSPEMLPLSEVEIESTGEGAALSSGAVDGELMERLKESLSDLDAAERSLIEEFYFEEKTQQAMAEERQTSSKAVESKLARIRQKLRTILLTRLRYEK
jgi:RNA polymerase sigma factor (sigma-70 family)